MPTKAWRNSVADNEGNNDGSVHLIQCTRTGPDGKDCVASIWLPQRKARNFMDRHFFMWFCVASGIEKCKTLPPSDNADITSLFCADSNEQFGRRDNIRISGVEKFNDGVVFERVLEVASDIGVTISEQDISLCHHLPSETQDHAQ